jgi:site-specific DNA-methyltransferase (adenine-specific)
MYRWVPVQSWDRTWTDAEINALYGITEEEATHIASLIRPMGGDDE